MIDEHNEAIARTIHSVKAREHIDIVVLAQLSMSIFSLSYPNPEETFGIKVLNSVETGFTSVRDLFCKK